MARAAKWVAPDLSNATPTMLLDEMGKLSIMEGQIKKMRSFYKEAYYARIGIKEEESDGSKDYTINGEPIPEAGVVMSGETFIATTVQSFPNRLDQTAFKEAEPEMFEKYVKIGNQLTTRFALAEGVVNPVVNDLLAQLKAELDLD